MRGDWGKIGCQQSASTNLAFPPCGHPSVALVARSSLSFPSLWHSRRSRYLPPSAPSPLGPSSHLDLPLPLPLPDRLDEGTATTINTRATHDGREGRCAWYTRVGIRTITHLECARTAAVWVVQRMRPQQARATGKREKRPQHCSASLLDLLTSRVNAT